jgi:hypothetical protein
VHPRRDAAQVAAGGFKIFKTMGVNVGPQASDGAGDRCGGWLAWAIGPA